MAKGKKTPVSQHVVAAASTRVGATMQMPYASGSWTYGWFGPGTPPTPVAQQAEGRQFDYPFGYNLDQRPRSTEGITFEQLRALADNYDLLRLVIETRKDQIESYEWEIVAKEDYDGKVSDDLLKAVRQFFLRPDREHMWTQWLRMFLEDMFVMDAACVYPRATRGGEVWSFELIDGATVKRLLDDTGRTPVPPEPAYQQVLKGMVAANYTSEELVYFVRNPRSNRVYGYSPVEQILMTVNIAMRRQITQLEHFTDGNVPDALASVPDSWNANDIKQFQLWWDQIMEGDQGRRSKLKFIPTDSSKVVFTRTPDLKDMFDEWLARIVCFAFSISPTSLVKETNRATAETVQKEAKAEGLTPLLTYLKRCFDFMIETYLDAEGIEFRWKTTRDLEPMEQANIDKIHCIDLKIITPDELRKERLGKEPLTDAEKETAWPTPAPPPNPFGGALGSAPDDKGGGGGASPFGDKKPAEGGKIKPEDTQVPEDVEEEVPA